MKLRILRNRILMFLLLTLSQFLYGPWAQDQIVHVTLHFSTFCFHELMQCVCLWVTFSLKLLSNILCMNVWSIFAYLSHILNLIVLFSSWTDTKCLILLSYDKSCCHIFHIWMFSFLYELTQCVFNSMLPFWVEKK